MFVDEDVYKGEFKDNKFNGKGTYYYKDGSVYTGDWSENKKNGEGTLIFADGDKYTGRFRDDKFNGRGTYITADGKVTSGSWVNNELSSKPNHNSRYSNDVIRKSQSSKKLEQFNETKNQRDRIKNPNRLARKDRSYDQYDFADANYIGSEERNCPPGCVPERRVRKCPPGCMPDPNLQGYNSVIELPPIYLDRC
jgi:hypothetical protein